MTEPSPPRATSLPRKLAGLGAAAWRRHTEWMNTHPSYAALITLVTAALLGEIATADAKRWLTDLLPRLAALATAQRRR